MHATVAAFAEPPGEPYISFRGASDRGLSDLLFCLVLSTLEGACIDEKRGRFALWISLSFKRPHLFALLGEVNDLFHLPVVEKIIVTAFPSDSDSASDDFRR
jgi:hypothetical protein